MKLEQVLFPHIGVCRLVMRAEANKLSFDMYLQATHQTHEDWEAELHRTTERKFRSEMGLLLVAKAEGLALYRRAVSPGASALERCQISETYLPGKRCAPYPTASNKRPGTRIYSGTQHTDSSRC